jgi:hypothetical protein
MSDTMSEEGARRLAETIRAYWARRGASVCVITTWVRGTHGDSGKGTGHFAVRSDLVRGLPERAGT